MRACKHAGMNTPRTLPNPTLDVQYAASRSKEPLQVRLPAGIKRQFKAHAALRGLEPHELFVEVWQHYERTRIDAFSSSEG